MTITISFKEHQAFYDQSWEILDLVSNAVIEKARAQFKNATGPVDNVEKASTDLVKEGMGDFEKKLQKEYPLPKWKNSIAMTINSLRFDYFLNNKALFGDVKRILSGQGEES